MGTCSLKGVKSQNQVLEHDGRQAPGKRPEDADGASRPDGRSSSSSAPAGNILDLFPQARCRAGLVGCAPAEGLQQKGWAEKPTRKSGEEPLASFKVGCVCKKGLKPESPNQDDFCYFKADDLSIFGVFDGHGPYGADVSGFVQEALPRCVVQDPCFATDVEQAVAAAFPAAHRLCTDAQSRLRFDCSLSGSTATLAVLRGGQFCVAHVGDSRAVLARRQGSSLVAEDLTQDHRPTCEGERRRIQAAGGQVRRLDGDIPHRVFLSGKMYPGLAMTRSIGDTVGATAGVTCVPDVAALQVAPDWRFVLICSDGIWEFITSQEAVELVARFPSGDAQRAAESLASEAWNRWIQVEGDVVDDITVIIAWFHDD